MYDAIVHQFMNQHATDASPVVVRHGNVDVILVDQAAPTGWVNPVPMEIGHVLVIVILVGEQQDHVFAMSRPPGRVLEGCIDVFQRPRRKRRIADNRPAGWTLAFHKRGMGILPMFFFRAGFFSA